MKKLIFLASMISIPLSCSTYALDISSYLSPKIPNNFNDLKTNMDSGCYDLLRNPFNNNCTVFWTQFNEYLITRGNVSNDAVGENAGHAMIPITCHIVRHKLDLVTNPDSTDKSHKTGDENYYASYNVKFSWYVSGNPFTGKENFFIHNNEVRPEFTSGTRDNNSIAEEYCSKGIANAIRSLNGTPI
jgi:hypothetical protein